MCPPPHLFQLHGVLLPCISTQFSLADTTHAQDVIPSACSIEQVVKLRTFKVISISSLRRRSESM
jgi:hypothetical protein